VLGAEIPIRTSGQHDTQSGPSSTSVPAFVDGHPQRYFARKGLFLLFEVASRDKTSNHRDPSKSFKSGDIDACLKFSGRESDAGSDS
jgi:hypothetical protein